MCISSPNEAPPEIEVLLLLKQPVSKEFLECATPKVSNLMKVYQLLPEGLFVLHILSQSLLVPE